MQALRNASFLARLVLAWFALALGAAVASPLVKPGAMELVCSGGTMKLLVQGGDNGSGWKGHTLDCPLCASPGAPPAAAPAGPGAVPCEPSLRVGTPIDPLTQAAAAPLPARGPPALTIL